MENQTKWLSGTVRKEAGKQKIIIKKMTSAPE
jgi:hypothetical protein